MHSSWDYNGEKNILNGFYIASVWKLRFRTRILPRGYTMFINSSEWKATRDLQQRPSYLVAIETTVLGIIFVVSTTGNTFSCFIMYTSSRLRTWHNLLLLNVIFVDLLAAITCVPFAFVVLLSGRWVGGETLCSVVAFASCLLLTVSIITLATISISRYFLITNLLRYMTIFKKKNIAWMLFAIWVFAITCTFPPFVGWGDFIFLPGNAMCFIYFQSSLSYAAVFTLLVIGLPVAVIIASFVKVRKGIKINKRTKPFSLSTPSIASEEIHSARTLFSVVIMVLLCWFPMLIIFLLATAGVELPRQAALIATYSIFLPCALKPIIYFYMKKQFRAGLFELLRKVIPVQKRKRRNRVSHDTNGNGAHRQNKNTPGGLKQGAIELEVASKI